MWKTSDPQFLSLDADLPFLGVSIRMTKDGILLHQHHYTQDLLHNRSSHISARKRHTSGEPTHFQKDLLLPPDPINSEHQRWIKIGQRMLGGLLWLSTRARPDLAFAVSSGSPSPYKGFGAAQDQAQTPFCNTWALLKPWHYFTHTLGIERWLTLPSLVTLLLPPLGSIASQDTQFISLFANTRHLIHWQSLRETKIAESSAQAELYALATARKFASNFRLLIQESFAISIVMSLRCDNTAAISMLKEQKGGLPGALFLGFFVHDTL